VVFRGFPNLRKVAPGAALGLALLAGYPAIAAPPSRIVSINLCTDELLLALADPGQIAALSPYATDAGMTLFADKAAAFRHDAGDAETVIGLQPDLVVGGRFSKRAMRDVLKRLGYPIVELDVATSIAASIAQIRQVAALVGHPERGEALVGEIAAAEERAKAAAAKRGPAPTVTFYQRRGYVTGGDTLTGELIALVGLRNIGSDLAGETGGLVPLERIVAARPQYLLVDTPIVTAEDQGSALLAHPALARLYPADRRIVLPEKLTVCGGPSLAAAIERLSAEAGRAAGAAGP
jgi:iron complex transport system substrate-binding protein